MLVSLLCIFSCIASETDLCLFCAALFVFSELGPDALAFSETKKDRAEIFRMAVEEEMGETWYDEHVIPRRDAV